MDFNFTITDTNIRINNNKNKKLLLPYVCLLLSNLFRRNRRDWQQNVFFKLHRQKLITKYLLEFLKSVIKFKTKRKVYLSIYTHGDPMSKVERKS